jgi:hypothetical protein
MPQTTYPYILTPYQKGRRFGFANSQGEIVTSLKYSDRISGIRKSEFPHCLQSRNQLEWINEEGKVIKKMAYAPKEKFYFCKDKKG